MSETHHAELLATWLQDHPGQEPPASLLDGAPDVVEAVYALRPDLAPAARVTIDDVLARVTEGPLAAEGVGRAAIEGLVSWLSAHPGAEPPADVAPEVVEAVYALRPDLAPAPRVDISDILGAVTSGPLATMEPEVDEGAEVVALQPAAIAEPRVVPSAQSTAVEKALDRSEVKKPSAANNNRWWIGGGLGTLVAAALAMVVIVPMSSSIPEAPLGEVYSEAEPAAAPAAEPQSAAGGAGPSGSAAARDPAPSRRSSASASPKADANAQDQLEALGYVDNGTTRAGPAKKPAPTTTSVSQDRAAAAGQDVGDLGGVGDYREPPPSPADTMKSEEQAAGESFDLDVSTDAPMVAPTASGRAQREYSPNVETVTGEERNRAKEYGESESARRYDADDDYSSADAITVTESRRAGERKSKKSRDSNEGFSIPGFSRKEEAAAPAAPEPEAALREADEAEEMDGLFASDSFEDLADDEASGTEFGRGATAQAPAGGGAQSKDSTVASTPSASSSGAVGGLAGGATGDRLSDARSNAWSLAAAPSVAGRDPAYDDAVNAGDGAAMRTFLDHGDPDIVADAAYRLGRGKLAAGGTDEALAFISIGLDAKRTDARLRARLYALQGEVHERRGDTDAAIDSYKKAATLLGR